MNWYAARPNEIFCDLDSKKNLLRALRVIRDYMTSFRMIHIKDVFYYPTSRPGHGHLIVVTKEALSAEYRANLALWMGSDRLRACYVTQRIQAGFRVHADLLVTDRIYHREPDEVCSCGKKHKSKIVTDKCPALGILLGSHRSADYFPRVGTARKIKPLRVPIGKISKTTLIRWKGKR